MIDRCQLLLYIDKTQFPSIALSCSLCFSDVNPNPSPVTPIVANNKCNIVSRSNSYCRPQTPVNPRNDGHFDYGTARLLDSSLSVWSFRLLDTSTSSTGHFAYETFRLLPGQFAYRYYTSDFILLW